MVKILLIITSIVAAGGISQNIETINSIDTDQTKYYSIPAPTNSDLGNCSLITSSSINYTKANKKTITGKDVYSSSLQYKLYKFSKVASAATDALYPTYLDLDANSSVKLSYSNTKTKATTYSEQVSIIATESLSSKVGISVGYGAVKEEASVTATDSLSESYTSSINSSYTYSEVEGIDINFNITESGTYRLEKRALFDVYILQTIVGVYDVTYSKNKLYASSTFLYYTINSSYILSYRSGSDAIGLYKYNVNSNNVYTVDIDYMTKFYKNSDITFLD